MAKYIVTSGTTFQPYSYEQLAAPLAQAAEIHRQTQDVYDSLGVETAALQRYIDQEPEDSLARQMYQGYLDKLTALQDNLWQNGYNAQTRRDLSSAKSGFSKDILRLQGAVQSRQERSKEYWDIKKSHPDMIMGSDPGLANLDEYIKNDRYGQDYYTYSGDAFTKEVGEDAQARVKELFSNPELQRLMPGYLTLKTRQGVTSQDVANASQAILQKRMNDDSSLYDNLDPVGKILADVLETHIDSTGAHGKVSSEEFGRLIDYGISGLSQAIGDTKFEHQKDWMAEQDREFEIWKQKYAIQNAPKPGSGAGNPYEEMMLNPEDTHTHSITGRDYDTVAKRVNRHVKNLDKVLFTDDGQEIRNNLEASALVYSEDRRLELMPIFGFDIGLTPPTNKDDYLRGSIIAPDGRRYETWYDPDKRWNGQRGVVMIRPEGDRGNGKVDTGLTNRYRQEKRDIDNRVNYYKQNRKDIYKAADITPDDKARYYKNTGSNEISMDVPLVDYPSAAVSLPNSGEQIVMDTWVARDGSDDADYRSKFGSYLSGTFNFTQTKSGEFRIKEPRSIRKDTGKSTGIHEYDRNSGTLEKKPITDYDSVFRLDNDLNIINVDGIQLSYDAIMNDYLILYLSGSKAPAVGIGINMFDSDKISAAYRSARQALQENQREYDLGYMTYEEKLIYDRLVSDNLSKLLKTTMGYGNATQKKGATNKDDEQ